MNLNEVEDNEHRHTFRVRRFNTWLTNANFASRHPCGKTVSFFKMHRQHLRPHTGYQYLAIRDTYKAISSLDPHHSFRVQ